MADADVVPSARARSGRTFGALVLMAALTLMSLGAGYLVKNRCTTHTWDGFQYRSSCYNDIYALYSTRHWDRQPWPYVHGDGELKDPENGDLEYPVGTGYFIGAVASSSRDGVTFFRRTALGLAAFALIAVAGLTLIARDRRRVLYFALAPPLVLYAFHNWDLLAVWAMVVAMVGYAWDDDLLAGSALGVGAATKLFPGLLVPVFALARWRATRRFPVRLVASSAVFFVALNLPVLLINARGWLLPWKFQSTRFPNYETSWYFVYRHVGRGGASPFWFGEYPELTGLISGALFLAGMGVLLWRESRRERVRPFALGFGVLLIFLLTAKVYSPQYALWLLPFFALVRIPWYGYAAFAATDAAVWTAISGYFLAVDHARGSPETLLNLLEAAVILRYVVLGWLLWYSRRADENVAYAAA